MPDTKRHHASTALDFELSRKVSLGITDQLVIAPYAYGAYWGSVLSSTPMSSSTPSGITYSIPVTGAAALGRQRLLRNLANANLSVAVTRKLHLGFFISHELYQYEVSHQLDFNAINAGATLDYQITKWLSFSNSYSTYLNKLDLRYQDAKIQRLQVGGLNFKLSRGWQVTAGGGVEYSNYWGTQHWGGSALGSLSWNSTGHSFTLNYNRGLTSAVGMTALMQAQQATAIFGTRLTSWMHAQLAGYYVRSTDSPGNGRIEYYFARTGLEFAVLNNLLFSVYGMSQAQRANYLGPMVDTRRGYSVHMGLQYMYPGGRRRS